MNDGTDESSVFICISTSKEVYRFAAVSSNVFHFLLCVMFRLEGGSKLHYRINVVCYIWKSLSCSTNTYLLCSCPTCGATFWPQSKIFLHRNTKRFATEPLCKCLANCWYYRVSRTWPAEQLTKPKNECLVPLGTMQPVWTCKIVALP